MFIIYIICCVLYLHYPVMDWSWL